MQPPHSTDLFFQVIGYAAIIIFILFLPFSAGSTYGRSEEKRRWIKAARKGKSIIEKEEAESKRVSRIEYIVTVKEQADD